MKFLILIFVCIVSYDGMVSGACTPELKNKLNECYNIYNFPLNSFPFRDNFPSMFADEAFMHFYDCKEFGNLESCLTSEVKEKCLNADDFSKVFYLNPNTNITIDDVDAVQDGIHAIVNYLQHEYVCSGNATKVLKDHRICIGTQGVQNDCALNFDNYDLALGYATCATNRITNRCGAAAGCFAQKVLSVQPCYAHDTAREECTKISYKNNPIKGCDADILYVPGGNGNSYVLSFVLMIVTLFIF